jgi:hypothetical protein
MDVGKNGSASGARTAEQSAGANISYIAGRVWTGGDLPSHLDDAAMLADLSDIKKAGITHILDNRIECSDEAFAILLATGMEPVAALTAIRQARPIAAIAYADDALDWFHRMTQTPAKVARRQRAEVASWHRRNPIDVVRIIRTIRNHEDNGRPLSA